MDVLSLAGHVGAAVSAGAEIYEDVEGIGHGHGMLLLCSSRLCRELNVMREAVVEEAEDLKTRVGSRLRRPVRKLVQLLGSNVFVVALAVGGLAAAIMEVVEDVRPGGHHGALFLAVNELLELLTASRIARGRLLHMIEKSVLRLLLLSSAVLLAGIETYRTIGGNQLGAHHGVLWLGACKTARCVGLLKGRLKEKAA